MDRNRSCFTHKISIPLHGHFSLYCISRLLMFPYPPNTVQQIWLLLALKANQYKRWLSYKLTINIELQEYATGADLHADVIFLLPRCGIKKGVIALWHLELRLHQPGSRSTVFIPRWTTHPCILHQVCATRGATAVIAFCSNFVT